MTSFWRRNGSSVPLGVDLGADSVSIVAAQASSRGFTVTETRTQAVGPARSANVDLAIAETVRELVGGLKTRERRCVLGAPAGDVVTRTFRMPPRMGRREAERAAALEADAIVDWPASERVVALDPLPGKPHEMLLSIARTGPLDRLVAIARAGGLRPVAVDTTACAWRRAVPDADAILDCASDRAVLEIFGDPVGVTHVFPPRLIDDRLASQMRSAFVEARRDGVADVGRLAVLASRFRFESLEELLRDDGCTVAALTLGDVEAPTWSFAYGLATWSLASYAYPVTAR
jgi:hypothetical protein